MPAKSDNWLTSSSTTGMWAGTSPSTFYGYNSSSARRERNFPCLYGIARRKERDQGSRADGASAPCVRSRQIGYGHLFAEHVRMGADFRVSREFLGGECEESSSSRPKNVPILPDLPGRRR
jgi:hypothetical protein